MSTNSRSMKAPNLLMGISRPRSFPRSAEGRRHATVCSDPDGPANIRRETTPPEERRPDAVRAAAGRSDPGLEYPHREGGWLHDKREAILENAPEPRSPAGVWRAIKNGRSSFRGSLPRKQP